MSATVLIVGNDKKTTANYSSFLKKDYGVVAAHSGRQALAHAKVHRVDALIVDTTSPRLNCKNLCRRLRVESSAPLILIASPATRLDSSLSSAQIVHTPVVGKKLAAKVKALLDAQPPRLLTVGNISLDLERRRVTRGNRAFALTPKEFLLLRLLMGRAGQTVTRKTLMKEIWETDYLGDTRTLDVHIRWIREKVEENPSKPERVQTLRGMGYRFIND